MRKCKKNGFSRLMACVLGFCIIVGIVWMHPVNLNADVIIDGVEGIHDFSLDIYRADYYLEDGRPANNAIKSMRSFTYPSQTLVDDLNNNSFSKQVNAWKAAHFATSPSEIPDGKLDEKGYYEAIILSIYVSQSNNSNFYYDQVKKINSEANSVLKNVSAWVEQSDAIEVSKISRNQILSELTGKEQETIMEYCGGLFAKNHPLLDNAKFITGTMKTVFSTSGTIKEAFERMCAYTQLCDLSQQQKAVLQEMYDLCPVSNVALKSALAEIASSMDSYNDALIAAVENAALEQGSQFLGVLMDEGWNAVIKVNPYVAAFMAGASIGTFIGDSVCNTLFSTDKTIEQYVKMKCLGEVNQLLQSVLSNLEKKYQSNKTDLNAESYFEAVDAMFAIASLSCDFAREYGEIIYEDALIGGLVQKPEDVEQYYETVDRTKINYENLHEIVARDYLDYLKGDNPKVYNIIMGIENVVRDIVLVLDRSGSMEGEPLGQTKEAALNFLDTVFENEEAARVSVVTYDSTASVNCGLTDDKQELTSCIESIYSGDMTNMYAGLEEADLMLQESTIEKKIIVLMSDGVPNEGVSDGYDDYSEPLLRYAKQMKDNGYYIYTLGFFMSIGYDELYSAQQLMEGIASPGLHYEVESASDLVFFFEDIANQISGTQYVHIRIACPVDVTVSSGGDMLSSKADAENTRTSFGTLTYENIQNEDEDGNWSEDRVKILRLNMEKDYDVEIEGYGNGTMDYTVSFPNESGEYDDVRMFPGIEVTESTKAASNTSAADATYLKVDKDGDGKPDVTYKTKANGEMEEVEDHTVLYIVLSSVIVFAILILILVIVLVHASGKKKDIDRVNATGEICGAFGIFQGKSYPIGPGEKCVVGRKATCDIQLVHGQVSRVHCVIQMLPDGVYQVTDYSSNGTFYNDQKLKNKQPYRLPKGALLAIGDADNVLELR